MYEVFVKKLLSLNWRKLVKYAWTNLIIVGTVATVLYNIAYKNTIYIEIDSVPWIGVPYSLGVVLSSVVLFVTRNATAATKEKIGSKTLGVLYFSSRIVFIILTPFHYLSNGNQSPLRIETALFLLCHVETSLDFELAFYLDSVFWIRAVSNAIFLPAFGKTLLILTVAITVLLHVALINMKPVNRFFQLLNLFLIAVCCL